MEEIDESKVLFHSSVLTDLHSKFTPHRGQVPIGKALFNENKKRIFIECGRKFGKQIDIDEQILTPSGFVRYGDLKVGDVVYDENGKKQFVTYLSEINYSPEAYRVHFCNGSYIDACAEHRWATYTKLDRRAINRKDIGDYHNRKPTIRTTKEIFETQMHGKEFNHSIPYCKPIEMNKKEYLIDPYVLGCWLGDGHAHGARITSADEEILNEFRSRYGLTHYSNYDYGILSNFVTDLKKLNLLKNKHIPPEYLLGSIEQRLALLQGLMDTDGTIDKLGRVCTFDSTNKNLADGVEFLVSSLGMKCNRLEKIGKLKGVEHKKCYRVNFKALMPVFRLKRKLERITPSKKSEHHTIIKVEKIESKPMRCISVSGNSKLYLIGKSLIPTHNTEIVLYCLYRWCLLYPNSYCYYIAPFKDQIKDLVWANGRLPYFLSEDLMKKYGITINNTDFRVIFSNGSFIKCDGADNYEKGRGYSATGLVVYDEFKDHNPKFHDGFEPNLAITDAPLIFIGTPPDSSEPQFDRWCSIADEVNESPVGYFINRPSMTNPHVSKEYFIRKRAELVKKGELWKWQKEYEAKRVRAAGNNIFPMLDRRKHVRQYDDLVKTIRMSYKHWDFFASFDPGSAKCFAVTIGAVNRYSKQVLILDEIYATKLEEARVSHIVPLAVSKMRDIHPIQEDWYCVYDYAATWFMNEVQGQYADELNVHPCQKDLKNKENKLSLIKDMLLKGFFILSDRCEKTFWEMEKYATDENGKIPKEDDHAIDTVRYLLNAANYHQVPVDEPLSEKELYKDRVGFRLNSDPSLEEDDLYGNINSDLFYR